MDNYVVHILNKEKKKKILSFVFIESLYEHCVLALISVNPSMSIHLKTKVFILPSKPYGASKTCHVTNYNMTSIR